MMKEIIKSDHFAFPKCSFFSKIMRISLICFLFSTLSAVAGTSATQQSAKNSIIITGTVIDDLGDALPGVNVIVKGIKSSTITDNYGKYTVKVPYAEASLIFSYVGFQPQEIELEGRTAINITLVEDRKALEEVVVVGYSTQKKATIVGSVSTITTKDLQQSPTANINNALAGRMPGLMVNQFSGGEPGVDKADLKIRGFSTYGDNSPIVIVDGVEREMSYLAAEEIETFTILKDASSTAAFGIRGANGVIIVSTKRGKAQEKATVNFKASTGYNEPVKFPEYLGSADYATLYNEARTNDGDVAGLFSQTAIDNFRKAKGDNSDGFGYDWNYFDYAFQPGYQQDYSLSIRGGSDKARYYVLANYFDQSGNYSHTNLPKYDTQAVFKRYNFRTNMDIDINKDFYARLDISARITDRNAPGTTANRVVQICNTQAPYLPMIVEDNGNDANANFLKKNPSGMLYGDQFNRFNLLGELSRTGFLNEKNTYMNGSFALGHKLNFITKGLKVEANFSYDASEGRWINRKIDTYSEGYRTYPKYATFTPADGGANVYMEPGHYLGAYKTGNKFEIDETMSSNFSHNSSVSKAYYQLKLDYARNFGDHAVSALIMGNRSSSATDNNIEVRYEGISARATYDFSHRYLAEFNMGYNGSENFAVGSRYGFFPAGAVGWVVSEEPFMEGTKYWLNNLKIRSSYGLVGSDNTSKNLRFTYLQYYNYTGNYSFGTSNFSSGAVNGGVAEGDIANPNISWETSKKFNIGVDASMLKDRLTFNVDFFSEDRYDILTNLSRPGRLGFPDVVGAVAPIINSGKVSNKGVDIEIGWRGKIGKDFRYSIHPNFTFARNKILFQNEVQRDYSWRQETGHRIGEHYVYVFDRFVANQEEADQLNASNDGAGWQPFGQLSPGDCVYKDLNGDKKIDENGDLTAMGNPRTPEIQFGLPISLQYKGIDVSFLFQGATNGSLLLNGPAVWDFSLIENDMHGRVKKMHLNRWTPETAATATYPALHYENNLNNKNDKSSLYLYDASYLRLKNVEIGYTLPRSVIQFAGFQNVRFYLQGLNLLTFDGLDDVDVDPETGDGNGSWYPVQRVINFGVDINY